MLFALTFPLTLEWVPSLKLTKHKNNLNTCMHANYIYHKPTFLNIGMQNCFIQIKAKKAIAVLFPVELMKHIIQCVIELILMHCFYWIINWKM